MLSVSPLVAAFTRVFASSHLVNRFHQHIYKAIRANSLVNRIGPLVNESFTRGYKGNP